MTLSVVVRLRHGRYDAARSHRSQAEWPPAPARVFCALVASMRGEEDREALRWLERQSLPQVWDPGPATTSSTRSFVVTNRIKAEGGSQSWPGRTNNERYRASAVPPAERFAIVWPEAEPDEGVFKRLHRLALRVPYVGRSTSMAEVNVQREVPEEPGPAGWRVFEPTELHRQGEPLAAPYPGYLAALDDAYDRGMRAHEVARTVSYVAEGSEAAAAEEEPVEGPFRDLLVWGLERGHVPVPGPEVARIAAALRKAVMSRIDGPAEEMPPQVHGHGVDGRAHVAFLALPHVGSRHADGHVLGVAIALPRDLPQDDWIRIGRAVLVDRLSELRVAPRLPVLRLAGVDAGSPWGLQARRWTGEEGGVREWVTATPVLTDGRMRRGRSYDDLVRASLRKAGYPEPAEVATSPAPMSEGAVRRPAKGSVPERYRDRPLVHARVSFERPVVGPVLAGAMRYSGGLGLFVPWRPHRQKEGAEKA
ncbi:type I-U CRISPR-associated protein Csb2 [Streptomyces sp. HNM0574]|uniref:type I-G CRISPR-associated protein Csb2 n=1 Tax=Streptomyces sp. HNM0574 TaxID=2714954 RepID=UPI00146A819D|nr:type I-U CRISPR-associated protein Csb2 [Streptomyces sp. HNM0574]NLU70861.1 type I-U CRISPR-associated protein Cas5/Cas6 [Streptomyces sp. HNM0574]